MTFLHNSQTHLSLSKMSVTPVALRDAIESQILTAIQDHYPTARKFVDETVVEDPTKLYLYYSTTRSDTNINVNMIDGLLRVIHDTRYIVQAEPIEVHFFYPTPEEQHRGWFESIRIGIRVSQYD
jgi:hypothetical protein